MIKRDIRLRVDICLEIPDETAERIREKLIEDGRESDDEDVVDRVINGLAVDLFKSDRGVVIDDPIITSWDDMT